MAIRIGTAGWTIGRPDADQFPATGTSLERYAARFPVVEINSSFHRPHRPATWARWREAVPDSFGFSVKIPKEITHRRKLKDCESLLEIFLGEAGHLEDKLGVLLLQLPPKREFEHGPVEQFLRQLTRTAGAAIVCEPRHPSWFTPAADELLRCLRIARAAADPAIVEAAAAPGGWTGLSYFRLHGSPIIYRSSYADRIGSIAATLLGASEGDGDVWCIFDNTASSAAISDALALQAATSRLG